MDFEQNLNHIFRDVTWDYQALLHTTGKTSPIPKESKVVTAILENYAVKEISKWAKTKSIQTTLPTNEREYPDLTLDSAMIGGVIALDIKTARIKNKNRIGKLTLGSYGGYFRNPNKKMNGCRLPYAHFDEHWIVAFLYEWDADLPSDKMVKIQDVVISEKWKIASKSSGTGTTKHIGSITDILKLKAKNGTFQTQEEFEKFWRNY